MLTFKIALMGAQASGKTQLTRELTQAQPKQPPYGDAQLMFSDAPPLQAALLRHQQSPHLALLHATLAEHQRFDFTLVCGLDLHPAALRAQELQDAALRACLCHAKLPFAVIYGQGHERLAAAQRALEALTKTGIAPAPAPKPLTRWHASCENCSDPACERALFTGLLKNLPY